MGVPVTQSAGEFPGYLYFEPYRVNPIFDINYKTRGAHSVPGPAENRVWIDSPVLLEP